LLDSGNPDDVNFILFYSHGENLQVEKNSGASISMAWVLQRAYVVTSANKNSNSNQRINWIEIGIMSDTPLIKRQPWNQ
jgi:hypothetical protein